MDSKQANFQAREHSHALGFASDKHFSAPFYPGAEQTPCAALERFAAAYRATGDAKLFISPVVRRLAREHDVDLGLVAGTGRDGRISRRDMEAFIADGGAGTGFVSPPEGYRPGLRMPFGGFARRLAIPFDPDTAERFRPQAGPEDSVEELSLLGRAMANHMAYTWWRAPHVSTLVEVDMAKVSEARRQRRFSYTVYIAHALARVLPKHAGFNSSLTDDLQRIVHRGVNLGIAVAKPDGGLVVPVIRGVEAMSIEELDQALSAKVEKARQGKLTAEDLRGGTFTITPGTQRSQSTPVSTASPVGETSALLARSKHKTRCPTENRSGPPPSMAWPLPGGAPMATPPGKRSGLVPWGTASRIPNLCASCSKWARDSSRSAWA